MQYGELKARFSELPVIEGSTEEDTLWDVDLESLEISSVKILCNKADKNEIKAAELLEDWGVQVYIVEDRQHEGYSYLQVYAMSKAYTVQF